MTSATPLMSSVEEEYEALLQFLYIAPVGLAQTRLDGEIVMVNPLCARLLMPLSADGQLSNLFSALESLAPDLHRRAGEFVAAQGSICDAFQLFVPSNPPHRKTEQILSLSLLKLDSERLMAVLSDVTTSVRRERGLRQNQAWMNSIANGANDYAFVSVDDTGRIGNWNPSIGRVTGFASDAVVGQCYSLFYPADGLPAERVQDRLHEADRNGWSMDEGWRVRADGSRFWGSSLIAPTQTSEDVLPERQTYSLILRDISDHREAAEAARQSVSSDPLTGLANRRAFFEAAALEMQRWARMPRPLSLVMIEADHFARINDMHGQLGGDAVLRHLAAALSANFRTLDLVARIGGEAFMALLPGASLEMVEAVAQRVCLCLASQSVEVEGTPIPYTVSIGVAVMDADVNDLDDLMQRADAAMCAAKANGRNRVERWTHDLPRALPRPQNASPAA
ncbi:hypothetical protein BH11PSE10_BH11PSE10_20290 [soil metagenome]